MAETIGLVAPMDLPVSESDAVEVVVIENEELKRKPVDGLGGGSGFDIIIHYDTDNWTAELVQGDYNTLSEKFNNRLPILVMIAGYCRNEDGWEYNYDTVSRIVIEGDHFTVYDNNFGYYFGIYPDNSVVFWSYD